MTKLREAIGSRDRLVTVSDRHDSIPPAIVSAFPDAHHGICVFHLKGILKG